MFISPRLFSCIVTPPPRLYPLSLHDALPISATTLAAGIASGFLNGLAGMAGPPIAFYYLAGDETVTRVRANLTTYFVLDRKSTRLNSSHSQIPYAVFCLKKKTYDRHVDVYLTSPVFLHCDAAPPALPSFPTRRSSDLGDDSGGRYRQRLPQRPCGHGWAADRLLLPCR